MPIKKDEPSQRRWVEMQLVVPGTPEQVWQAMATGPGNAAWFTRAEIEERVGGTLRFIFGPGISTEGEVTHWQPPQHFGYVERGWMEGAPPCFTELEITGRDGGKCLVRMVHSLFTSDEKWDDQLESFESGWPGFFAILKMYLAHFAGRTAGSFQAMGAARGTALEVWQGLLRGVGLHGADRDEERTLAGGAEDWRVVVEGTQQDAKIRTVLLRLAAPEQGVALLATVDTGKSIRVSLSTFLYGENAPQRAEDSRRQWQAWMDARYAAVTTACE